MGNEDTKITTTVVNAKMRNWVVVRVYTDVAGLTKDTQIFRK